MEEIHDTYAAPADIMGSPGPGFTRTAPPQQQQRPSRLDAAGTAALLDELVRQSPKFTSPDWTEDGKRRQTPRPAWMGFGPDVTMERTRTESFFDFPGDLAAAPAGEPATSPATKTMSASNGEQVGPEPALTTATAPATASRPSAPTGGSTIIDSGVVADLIGRDAEKRRAARTTRQDAVVAAWAAQARPVAAEIDSSGLGEQEPWQYSNAANALSAGCDSRFSRLSNAILSADAHSRFEVLD